MSLYRIWIRGLEALCLFIVFSCTVFMMVLALSTVSNGIFMIVAGIVMLVVTPFLVGAVLTAVRADD